MPDLITHLSISYFLNKPFKIFRYSTLFYCRGSAAGYCYPGGIYTISSC